MNINQKQIGLVLYPPYLLKNKEDTKNEYVIRLFARAEKRFEQ